MTNEDKIKVLAELDGWRHSPFGTVKPGTIELGTPPNYLTSYDAIIPLIQKQDEAIKAKVKWLVVFDGGGKVGTLFDVTHAQLCDALIKAVGKWKD